MESFWMIALVNESSDGSENWEK